MVYPGWKPSGRRYDPAREAAQWARKRAWEFVGSFPVPRQVDSQGQVSLDHRPYSEGVRWSGRTIRVGFDPATGEWVFQDELGHEIRRQVAVELSAKRIRALEVTPRRRGCHAAKPHERTK